MRKTTWLLVVGILSVCSAVDAADFVRLGTFNIEHLGKRTPPQRPIAIAEHIDLSGANLLALQELYVTDSVADDSTTPWNDSRRSEALNSAFGILNSEGDTEWVYEIFPNRDPSDTSQLVGVAWDAKRIKRIGPAFAIDVSGHPNASAIWDRRPHAVKFQYGADKTDFVLIPIHMKSNYGSASQGRSTRAKEADALIAQLDAVKQHFGGEDDIIIGGDTNFLAADENAAQTFAGAGLRDTNSLDVPTYIGSGNGAPFDRFFLSESPEFVFARQYILQATEPVAHDEYLSDHQMALMSFRVKRDDD